MHHRACKPVAAELISPGRWPGCVSARAGWCSERGPDPAQLSSPSSTIHPGDNAQAGRTVRPLKGVSSDCGTNRSSAAPKDGYGVVGAAPVGAQGTEIGAMAETEPSNRPRPLATRASLSQSRSCGPNVAWRFSSRRIRDPSGNVASRAAPLVRWMWLLNWPNLGPSRSRRQHLIDCGLGEQLPRRQPP